MQSARFSASRTDATASLFTLCFHSIFVVGFWISTRRGAPRGNYVGKLTLTLTLTLNLTPTPTPTPTPTLPLTPTPTPTPTPTLPPTLTFDYVVRGIINFIVGWAGLSFQFGLPLYRSYRSSLLEQGLLLVRLPLPLALALAQPYP